MEAEKVKVITRQQIDHKGKTYKPGDVWEADADQVEELELHGWVERVESDTPLTTSGTRSSDSEIGHGDGGGADTSPD